MDIAVWEQESPSPLNPGLQTQVNDPGVFVQEASASQLCDRSEHSFWSARMTELVMPADTAANELPGTILTGVVLEPISPVPICVFFFRKREK